MRIKLSRATKRQRLILKILVISIIFLGTITISVRQAASPGTSGLPTNTLTQPSDPYLLNPTNEAAVQGSQAPLQQAITQGFIHPGILVNKTQLDFVRAKIAAGAQPWKSAFEKARKSKYAADEIAKPVAVVECGPYNNPNIGCITEIDAADQAYTQALLYYYTGQNQYAETAIKILNAWSTTLQSHTNGNAPLQTAWAAEIFPRAAEIIRYTYNGWSESDIQKFSDMLNNVYLPTLDSPTATNAFAYSNGNWELSMAEAKINIGIFTNNRDVFNQGILAWRNRVPAYIYLTTDGPQPKAPAGISKSSIPKTPCIWLNKNFDCTLSEPVFNNGQVQETCRDFNHVALGLSALFDSAETAYIQGVDLYGEQRDRLIAGLEYNTQILNSVTGTNYPSGFCVGAPPLPAVSAGQTYEIAYNHFVNRLGQPLPNTKTTINKLRASGGSAVELQMAWETLTHANTGKIR